MQSALKKIHLGCGLNVQEGWVNVDGSWNAWLIQHPLLRKLLGWLRLTPKSHEGIPWSAKILIHDVRRPLPFADGSASAVYASHLLEHLYREEAERLLKECFRVLAKGGVLRIMVPDLQEQVMAYHASTDLLRADRFVQDLSFRDPHPPRGNALYRLYGKFQDFHTHKWMYDAASLSHYLEAAGFAEVARRPLHESRIEDIRAIEKNNGLCVEGVKPRS